MIYGSKNDQSFQTWLEQCEHVFHLTGSKFFGPSSVCNDTDYFVQYSSDILDQLEKFGFKPIKDKTYNDKSIVALYRHNSLKIDIQVVKLAALKNIVQMFIKSDPERLRYYNAMNKYQRKWLWNFLMDFHAMLIEDHLKPKQ